MEDWWGEAGGGGLHREDGGVERGESEPDGGKGRERMLKFLDFSIYGTLGTGTQYIAQLPGWGRSLYPLSDEDTKASRANMSCPMVLWLVHVRVLIHTSICSIPKPTFVPPHCDASRNPLLLKRKGHWGVEMEREKKHRLKEANGMKRVTKFWSCWWPLAFYGWGHEDLLWPVRKCPWPCLLSWGALS